MKKIFGILVFVFLLIENVHAQDRPTLECVFNDKDKTTVIYDLNKYGSEDMWMMDENEYSWSSNIIKNGMKTIIIITIKRKTGLAELSISKPFPEISDLDVVLDAMKKGDITTGKCNKLKDQNL